LLVICASPKEYSVYCVELQTHQYFAKLVGIFLGLIFNTIRGMDLGNPFSDQRADPIMSPRVASSHVHAIVGGAAFNRTMNGNDSAVDALATTCDKFADHSNYVLGFWYSTLNDFADPKQRCPQLYQMTNGIFSLVTFTGAVGYP
jgi:hypothetical protein